MSDHDHEAGLTTSAWMHEDMPVYGDELAPGRHVDVCVVGAGIAGLSVAYHLAREGARVIVIDDGPVGGGETGRTTAHLASALDDRFEVLEKLHGDAGARLAAESHSAAIDDIEAIVKRHGIVCGFERLDGYLFAPRGESRDPLRRELEAARRAGLDVEMVSRAPLVAVDTGPALRFARQAQFHPLAYLRGLAAAFVELGGQIHTGLRVERVDEGVPSKVITEGGPAVLADAVVVATHAPITSRVSVPLRQAAYRSYVLALPVPIGSVAPALYWDNDDPYHYVRLAPGTGGNALLIVGGEDHRTGQDGDAPRRWTRLEEWTREYFPMAGDVVARWSGQIMEPADSLAFIGRSSSDSRTYIVTGDSGNGMTHGAIAGMLITDQILGRSNAWSQLYDPNRSALRAAGDLIRENANTAVQYVDWLSGGDVRSTRQIACGQGGVVRRGLHLVAVYRDEAGQCHERSAVCTHLGGVVRWNAAEKSWDCPCHGSRFDLHGRVVNGPAVHDLGAPGAQEKQDDRAPVSPEAVPSETPPSPEVRTRNRHHA